MRFGTLGAPSGSYRLEDLTIYFKMSDPRVIKELTHACRPLAIIMCIGYSIILILLVIALDLSPSRHMKMPTKFDFVSYTNFDMMAITSFIAAITCALFITATYIKSFWLAMPYLVVHVAILLHCFCFHIYLQFVIIDQYDFGHNLTHSEAYGFNQLHHNGSYTTFISVVGCCLLFYTLLPLWKFTRECQLIRRESGPGRRVSPELHPVQDEPHRYSTHDDISREVAQAMLRRLSDARMGKIQSSKKDIRDHDHDHEHRRSKDHVRDRERKKSRDHHDHERPIKTIRSILTDA